MSIRRGLTTHFFFFNLGGREHEIAVKEVALYLWMRYASSHPVKFVTVPFERVVSEIIEKVDNSQMGVVLKRMMLRAAEAVAEEMQISALVTGEAVAQVSSQTLPNLAVIDQVYDILVLRPLIMSEKQDIIDLARKIGTEEFSAVIPEYCGVISVKPTTRASLSRIEREERQFDMEILKSAIRDRVELSIDRVGREEGSVPQDSLRIEAEAGSATIIDIRYPDKEERKPLTLQSQKILKIPFFKLNSLFNSGQLDKSVEYLLYCDKGIMSRLHASFLVEQGFKNVGVYRPARI
jgi:thiamine biosynthesis protein ThiI